MLLTNTPPLTNAPDAVERLKFFAGQRLFAADLQALEDFNREMRWLHNRSLHQFGIASGYAVTGAKGDRDVTIGPGYALDNAGHEIVLDETLTIPVPPVANDNNGQPVFFDLTVRYNDTPEDSETRDGVCLPRAAVRQSEAPVFCWIELAATDGGGSGRILVPKDGKLGKDIANGIYVRLARAEVFNCRLKSALSIAERVNAKPLAQRFVAAGGDGAKDRLWNTPKVTGLGIQIETDVDTTSANFLTMPNYTAHIVGSRELEVKIGGKQHTLFLDGFIRIVKATAKGFTLSLLIPSVLIDPTLKPQDVADVLQAAIRQWHIEWLGVEA